MIEVDLGKVVTDHYEDLSGKPKINGVELSGDKTLEELEIASASELAKTTYKVDTVIAKANLGITETATGDEIHLIDSAEGKAVEYALYGKAKQQTTSGKNLLDNTAKTTTISGITFTVNEEDGTVTANGTAIATAQFFVNRNTINLLSGEKYILNGCPSGGGLNSYVVRINDGSNVYATDTGNSSTYTPETDKVVGVDIRIASGVTVNNLTFYPMIRLASITDDTWEPYTNGASPNPDYPQEIEVSGESGSVEVKSCVNQLLNYDKWKDTAVANGSAVYENNGITITANQKDAYTQYETDKFPIDARISVTEGEVITLSWEETTNKYGNVFIFPNGLTEGNTKVQNYNAKSLTYIVPSGVTFITFRFGVNDAGETISYKNIMINKGSEPLPYEPYREPKTATIPTPNGLAGIKVSSGGNYTDQNGQQWICDEVVKYADGSGKYIQRVEKVVFDGSSDEQWLDRTNDYTDKTNGQKRFSFNGFNVQYKASINIAVMSNIGFTGMLNNVVSYTDDGVSLYLNTAVPNTKNCYITVSNAEVTDLASFKTWLSNNNVVVYCELATPIETPLTAEELAEISTFYPVTNISNDFDCGMSVKYNCDSKNYIDKNLALQRQAQEAAMMNMFLLLPDATQAAMIENDTNNLLTESEN